MGAVFIERGPTSRIVGPEQAEMGLYEAPAWFKNPSAHVEFWKHASTLVGKEFPPDVSPAGWGLDGRLLGYNTDWRSAMTALKTQTGIAGEHFLLLGAGGAARAIAFGILENGGLVTITDLDAQRAEALAQEMRLEAVPLDALDRCPATILINATPVGMAPDLHGLPIDPELLSRFTLVMDIVYRPLLTRLLREAQAHGARIIDGLQMLIHQATAQFELWTGQSAPLETMSRAAYAALEEGG